ncbi:helix-turn-helix transcriptional regulator [Paenibacillus sp. y28]|uniref:helix-turn-helix transcriptional regulator n=1 Tax=Paenibacillus sp. y28 TaxID=3129110 RepID=UPI003015B7BD
MERSDNKAGRVLSMYDRLRKGSLLRKDKLIAEWGVTPKTVQRDMDEVRAYIADQYPGEHVLYDYQEKGYRLEKPDDTGVTPVEVFALVKILLESRAFCKAEMEGLLDAVSAMVSKPEQRAIKELVMNEKFHYQALTHGKPVLKMIWDLGQCILRKETIELDFVKMDGSRSQRTVYPLAVVFSEFYFYLIAQIKDAEYTDPAFFRVDRIERFKLLGRRYEYRRFEDGELKKRIQFMHGGELIRLKFVYRGRSLEAVLDRFPTAKVISQTGSEAVIEAEVFGRGCLIWLLSQGEHAELLGPDFLREELKRQIQLMYQVYDKE